ncbi:PREDICTED: maestro heat-like repeat-containing protein family member 9, partial [Galeopterus variegatus]|uniref:Maestro heat-like repeat-containing protein family member 9 n=1 Tax=Galeopterus variegatus TaxID=482537 RepID=A0ABM0S936_GALVR
VQTSTILWDAYSGLLSHQAMILALNSSFVDPLLQFESQLKIIESSFNVVVSIPSLDKVKKLGKNSEDVADLENLYQSILNIYEDTLLILVSKDLYKLQILKEMTMWMSEDESYVQERIMVIISRVLSFASRRVRGYTSVDVPCLGGLAAEMSLLCSHADSSITQQASLGMYHLLCIAKTQNDVKMGTNKCTKHESHYLLTSSSDRECLHKVLQRNKTKIAQNVGQTLLPCLLTDFVWNLLMKLSAPDHKISSEAASILELTLEYHAQKITMVSKIVDAIHKQLSENSSHIRKDAMLQVITLLTRASPKKVIFQLMDYPVPADNTLILMWQAAGSESSVAPHVLRTILLILKAKPGEMQETLEQKKRFSLDTTNMMPVAASQALCTLLPVGSYKKAVAQLFPQLLMALMLQIFYSGELRLTAQDKHFYARDALRHLLNCSGLQQVDIALERKNCWNQFSQTLHHHHGVYLVAKALSDYNFPQFPETLHYLYKLSVEGPRMSEDSVITVVFLTELLNNFFKDPFPEEFLILFRNWVNDSNPTVSKLSLQKIASMAPVVNEIKNVCSLLRSILDAFLSKDNTVVIRALITLRKLLVKLGKVTYSSLCARIAAGYYLLMDHRYGGIRSMAIRHFGELLRDMSQYTWMLNSVVLGGLVPLILFLEDKEIRVVKACKYTLEICASQLKWSISSLLKDENYNFELVVLNICRNLKPEKVARYQKMYTHNVSWVTLILLCCIGYLAKSGCHLLLRDEIEVMLEAIQRVLQDEDPVIKELAEITRNVFMDIVITMTSSAVKQTFRRWFKLIYIKKLKPLYHYNWLSDETGSPMDITNINGDKEGLIKKNDEDLLFMYIFIFLLDHLSGVGLDPPPASLTSGPDVFSSISKEHQLLLQNTHIINVSAGGSIQRVLQDEDPVIKELAEITRNVFMDIVITMTSSAVKQTFRRWFKLIYIKKLKPLYHYNWLSDETGSPMDITNINGDKEGLIKKNDEDLLVKNKRLNDTLEQTLEKE